jgi:hypothetical protein
VWKDGFWDNGMVGLENQNEYNFFYSRSFFAFHTQYSNIPLFGLGSNIGHGLFVGWVEHPDIFCWVSFLYPTYLPAIFVLSAKPNKMAGDRTIPHYSMWLPDVVSHKKINISKKL